jgi:hypothetical protein
MTDVMWRNFLDGRSVGMMGSEGGDIIRDEEHDAGARVTLERATRVASFYITCGISGWMVHTRWFDSEAVARGEFDTMKDALADILEKLKLAESVSPEEQLAQISPLLRDFVERFP